MEQFANNAQSTLSGTITSGATSLTVASATPFPSVGPFRILVESEYMIVTSLSGAVFTVTRGAEGSSAAAHANGVTVAHILTAAGCTALAAGGQAQFTQAMADANQAPALLTVEAAAIINCTGALTADRTLTLPAPGGDTTSYERIVRNNTSGGHNVVVSTGSGTTFTVPNAASKLVGIDSGGCWEVEASSATTPGGSNTQVQFNDSSSFGGSAHFTFTKATGAVAVAADGTGFITIGTSTSASGDVRLYSGATITANNGSGTDLTALNVNATDLYVATDSGLTASKQFAILHMYPGAATYMGIAGQTQLGIVPGTYGDGIVIYQTDGALIFGYTTVAAMRPGAQGHVTCTDSNANVGQSQIIVQALANDFTTSSNVSSNTNHTIAVVANEIWILDVCFSCNFPAASSKFQISTPAGASVEGDFFSANASGVVQQPRVNAINTLTAAIGPASGDGFVWGHFTVTIGATAGNIQIGVASATNTQTTKVYAKSYIRAAIAVTK